MNPKFSNSDKNRQQVIRRELYWHETEAFHRLSIDNILYAHPAFESIVQSAINFLNPRHGDTILEFGCGEGKEIVNFAGLGANVIGLDLSFVQLMRSKNLLDEANLSGNICLVQANAEELPFSTSSFQFIYCKAIIHHLDINGAVQEIDRILKPGGRVTVSEPLKLHPIFWVLRKISPQLRTSDEHPLTFSQLVFTGTFLHNPRIETYYLTMPLAYSIRLIPNLERIYRFCASTLEIFDTWLFKHFAFLQKFAWYGLLKGTKRIDR